MEYKTEYETVNGQTKKKEPAKPENAGSKNEPKGGER